MSERVSYERVGAAAFMVCLIGVTSAVASDLRIANWNMFNRPNSAADRAALRTVLQAMGDEEIDGASRPVDILLMQETDTTSSTDTRDDCNLAYGVSSYQVSVTAPDGGGDRTGFVYNTATLQLLGTAVVGGMTHPSLRGHFRPVGTSGEADFYVYAVHLKSGTTGSDATARTAEANVLRGNADALTAANIIAAGDFNWLTSSEGAWGNLTGIGGDGQLYDPVNAPGSWRDNPAFIDLHSQDPGAAMDDRFDVQLISAELLDGVGLEYVDASYRVFANNGTHTLNSGIATGTGAIPAVLTALTTVSDHLPVVCDYIIVPDVIEILGDFDSDGDVDTADFGIFTQCFGGSFLPPAATCPPGVDADLDMDGDVDLADFAIFTQNFTGSI